MMKRVLIAEDDISWVSIYKAILPSREYEILLIVDEIKSEEEIEGNLDQLYREAKILRKTESLLTENDLDFSIVNINLLSNSNDTRDLLGVELLEMIREKKPNLPIIVVSGDPLDVHYSKYKALDVDEVFYKGVESFSPAQFLKILKKILGDKEDVDQYDVFLCHNSKEKAAVKKIGEELRKKGIKPWLDEWELQPGKPWQRLLEEQISTIKSAAVFVGKSGIGPWQHDELDAFLREFKKRGVPVIPVLLDNAPTQPELPIFLNAMTWIDFRKPNPDPIKQLVWGITGKKP